MFVIFFPQLQVLLEPPRGGAHRRSREVSEILWKAIGKPWGKPWEKPWGGPKSTMI